MRHLELLAPARNADIGIAAINCGADAVYIGAPQFGARQAAGNNVEDIARLCDYAHLFGARIFVTLNTILYDSEIDQARKIMLEIQDAGADAIIVQDMAFAQMLRQGDCGLKIPIHASTQCSIRTPEKARWLEEAGFSRLILERQLSLEQIRAISRSVGCEIECFVHGALCVCYSGECYLSEMLSGRSANRGECIQACRSKYDLVDSSGKVLVKDKSLLSLRDFNLRDSLEKLIDAGVTSFKIEGRLKNESYVKNAVREYSLALDKIISKPENKGKYARASFGQVSGGFIPDTSKTFNRGYTALFLDGERGNWSAMDAAKSMGEELGTVSHIDTAHTSFIINPAKQGNLTLHNGDGLAFVSRDNEVVGMRADVCSGSQVRCKATPELYEGAHIWRNLDTSFEKAIESQPCRRLIGVTMSVGTAASTLEIHAISEDGRSATVCIPSSSPAEKQDRMRALFAGQLAKTTGHYSFHIGDISTIGSLPLMPTSAINALRRNLAAQLDSQPCHTIPLYNSAATARHLNRFSESDKWLPAIDYHANISNKISRDFHLNQRRHYNPDMIEMAYELTHTKGIELMRSKYCIRHELGLCPKHHHCPDTGPLFLVNNGRRLALKFDCALCEMIIL